MKPRMRNLQIWKRKDLLIKEQNVDVDDAGAFRDSASPPHPLFDFKADPQQWKGLQGGAHLADAVQKLRLVEQIDRLCAVNGRKPDDADPPLIQETQRFLQMPPAVAKI